jgi:hypothetical protein
MAGNRSGWSIHPALSVWPRHTGGPKCRDLRDLEPSLLVLSNPLTMESERVACWPLAPTSPSGLFIRAKIRVYGVTDLDGLSAVPHGCTNRLSIRVPRDRFVELSPGQSQATASR